MFNQAPRDPFLAEFQSSSKDSLNQGVRLTAMHSATSHPIATCDSGNNYTAILSTIAINFEYIWLVSYANIS